ncbi:MAG: RNA polymerase sigma factor [Sandaracinaceae bacterium]
MTQRSLIALEGGQSAPRALLDRAADGDEAAVRELYREHVDRIYRCAARILGPYDADVEDVVQQTFLGALEGAGSFDGRSKVSTWLVGIASKKALDAVRARSRRGRWSKITELVGLGRHAPAPDARHDSLSEAQRALRELSVEQRTVFVLHEVEGYTLKEIQEMTDTGISTLHARLKSARKRIDEHLRANAEEHGARTSEPGAPVGTEGGSR